MGSSHSFRCVYDNQDCGPGADGTTHGHET